MRVSILFSEKDDNFIRVSLRSKGDVDVARFAERFGGGGHARAAGLRVPGTLQEAYEAVLSAMVRLVGST